MVVKKLIFDIEQRTLTTEGGQGYLYVAVQPRADGESLLHVPDAFVFDTVTVLAHRVTPSVFYPFTCSCGVAGCAGIHAPADLAATDKVVAWTFPEKWLRSSLNPRLFPAGQPLVIEFDRQQYEAALDGLALRLLELEEAQALPVVFEPGQVWEEDLDKPVEARLQEARERFLTWQEGEAWRRRVFGPLLKVEVRAELSADLVYATTVELLAHFMAERIVGEGAHDCEERLYDCVESQIVPLFRESPEAILDAIHGYAWVEVEDILWPHSLDEDGLSGADPETDLAALWSDAHLSLAEKSD